MGALVSTGVHFSRGNNPCHPAWVTDDHAPDYNPLDLVALTTPNGIVTWTVRLGSPHEVPAPPAPATPGTWHYPGECPYVNGPPQAMVAR